MLSTFKSDMTQLTHNADSETTQTSPLSSSDLETEGDSATHENSAQNHRSWADRNPTKIPKNSDSPQNDDPRGIEEAEGSGVDRKTLNSLKNLLLIHLYIGKTQESGHHHIETQLFQMIPILWRWTGKTNMDWNSACGHWIAQL